MRFTFFQHSDPNACTSAGFGSPMGRWCSGHEQWEVNGRVMQLPYTMQQLMVLPKTYSPEDMNTKMGNWLLQVFSQFCF